MIPAESEFASILGEALARMAATELVKAAEWRDVERLWPGTLGGPAGAWAAEYECRSQIYRDWAAALEFSGGPVPVDYIRYGCSRDAACSPARPDAVLRLGGRNPGLYISGRKVL